VSEQQASDSATDQPAPALAVVTGREPAAAPGRLPGWLLTWSQAVRRRLSELWRVYWDPESELVVLTLASAVLAGAGIALIMMGGLPAAPAAAVEPTTLAADPAVRQPVVHAVPKIARRTPAALGRSVPRTLDVPSIGVHTKLISLGLESDGTVEVPPLRGDAPAGWYKNLSTPGEAGPAVLLGHVDSARDGPAVFYRLRELRRGAKISVQRADGSTAHFAVRSVVSYPKDEFPTEAVYGPQPDAQLRLVTCGGSFDTLRRRYRDNIVVYATLTSSTPAPKS
jgi:sortase (surface protein transpeptidase)